MINNQNSSWDLIISPKKGWFDLQLKKIWSYRDLLFLFVKRDIVSFYKQTIFGPLWYFVQPVFTTIVFTIIFGKLASLSTENIPAPLFYLVGVTAWNYYSECLLKTSTVFKDNAAIFGKVYFPRIISPISIVISNLLRFGIQLILLIILMLYYFYFAKINISINSKIFLLPFFVIYMAAQGLGFGMIISALTIKYRDLAYLVAFGLQLMMYSTTVVYPLSSLHGKMYWIVALNQITYIIEGVKASTIGVGVLSINSFLYSTISTLLILISGILLFNKVEKTFIDTI